MSLLENGKMTQKQIFEKRKKDAMDAIRNLYKRQNEEQKLVKEMNQKRNQKEEQEVITKKLNTWIVSQGMVQKRIEWLVKGTNFTIEMLKEEIRNEKYPNK